MRGTAFTISQFVQVSNVLTAALPQVLAKRDPKAVIAALDGNGSRLEAELDQVISRMLAPPTLTEPPEINPTVFD